ncbi:MAG: cytochrome c biogenesis protein CcdA [Chloroflexi bacterium]|nr:cytochrome c biogenesis protein CcdA [Chloroflexota bacterium]
MGQLNLAFAFTAGLVATVNPCGWAMLPSFVSYFLGSKEEDYQQRPIINRIWEGFVLGLLVTVGFLAVFGITGYLISAGLRFIVQWMPLAAILIGAVLVLLGFWLFTGKTLPFSLPTPKINLNARNPKSVFLFGVAYALVSLSCTLPIFLAVVGAGLAASGTGSLIIMFSVYGAGMAVVLMTVSLGAVFIKGTVVQWFNRFLPYVHKFGAAMLIIAGVYLIWYQGRYLPLIFAGL